MSEVAKRSKDCTKEEKDRLLQQFKVSGLRYDEFAREHNINGQTFKNWVWHSSHPGGAPRRYCPVERKKIVESYLTSNISIHDFAKTWGISPGTLSKWLHRYQEYGAEGLMNKKPSGKDKRLGTRTPAAVQSEIINLKKKEPGFGLKKMKQWMYRFRGVKVSTGTIRKTVTQEGLPLIKIRKKTRRSSEKVRRFERARPMQLWQSDITQLNVGQHSMRVYLTIFMDDHSRYIVGWRLQSRQTADLVIDAFKDAMVKFGKPEEVLTDQGRQYFAWRGKSDLERLLEKENIKHVVSRAHHPQTLGKCERFWETVANEFWTRVRPFDLEEARERLKYFIDHYNHQRPHQGLGGQVPADRFFGVAEEVRSAIEKSVAENSLRVAIGELPKPPAFLIGQVGDQRIAFHGTSGSFFLTNENIDGDKVNAIPRSESSNPTRSSCTHKELPAPKSPDPAPEGSSSGASAGDMGESISGRSVASAKKDCHHYGLLAGPDYQERSSGNNVSQTHPFLANEQSGSFRNECGALGKPSEAENGNKDR